MSNYDIPPPQYFDRLTYKNGKTQDIIQEVLDANSEKGVLQQTAQFARRFGRNYRGMSDLWSFVKHKIHYVEDPSGVQWIREPSRLWADREGDCKSFTLFICSVLYNMGIPYTIRFVTYSRASRVVTHVYPIAHLDGQDVIMDAVWTRFDAHKTPFYLKKDYSFMEISRLGSIGTASDAEKLQTLQKAANNMATAARRLTSPNDGVDITQLTEAEAIAYLTGGQVGGIGSNLPAFVLPTLSLDGDSINGVGSWLSQAGDWIKKQATSVVNTVKQSLASVINWVFKVALKKAGSFFLFAFITRKISPRVDEKVAAQQRIVTFIANTTGTSESVVMASIADGIQTETGKTPQEALNDAAKGEKVSGIGVAPAVIAAIINIIDTIIKFFNKPKDSAPPVAEAAADPAMLAEDAPSKVVANPNTGIVPPNVPRQADKLPSPANPNGQPRDNKAVAPDPAKDNSMLMWGGAALVGLYLMNQNKGVGRAYSKRSR